MILTRLVLLFASLFVALLDGCASSRSVLTQHNDSLRTGAYLYETQLTPSAVDQKTGPGVTLRYWRPVDGAIAAQLLYARDVQIGPDRRDVIYAFTLTNKIYAYDANEESDPGTDRGLVWPPLTLPAIPDPTFHVPAGILGTPVIDESRHSLYVAYEIATGKFPDDGQADKFPDAEFHLAAVDIRNGGVLRDVLISGSVASRVLPGYVDFVPRRQIQRAGLLLAPNPAESGHSTVYVPFAARWIEETHNWHGWVMAYDADTFEPRGVFCTTPDWRGNSEGGGIWQWGAGLAADADGNVFFSTGNGRGSEDSHGNSVVKLIPRHGSSGAYYFDVTAFDAAADDDPSHAKEWATNDIDLGAGGVTLIPGSTQLIAGGKTGVLYLIDRNTMNKVHKFIAFTNTYDPGARYGDWHSGPHLHGAPTYWDVSPARGLVFHWGEKDYLKRFDYDRVSGRLVPETVLKSDDLASKDRMPGGLISLSANGISNGVVWATSPAHDDTSEFGQIFAYDAISLRRLWGTTIPNGFSHNGPPTVADGRVIVGTVNGDFLVYGLDRPFPPSPVYVPRWPPPIPSHPPGPGNDPMHRPLAEPAR